MCFLYVGICMLFSANAWWPALTFVYFCCTLEHRGRRNSGTIIIKRASCLHPKGDSSPFLGTHETPGGNMTNFAQGATLNRFLRPLPHWASRPEYTYRFECDKTSHARVQRAASQSTHTQNTPDSRTITNKETPLPSNVNSACCLAFPHTSTPTQGDRLDPIICTHGAE